jgi:hypothetical protein
LSGVTDDSHDSPQTPPAPASVASIAEAVGYLGLVPFVVALALTSLDRTAALGAWGPRLALGYGACILTFVGAVHWGFAAAGRWAWSIGGVLGAIAPSMVATAALLTGGERGLGLLVLGFGLFWLYEHRRRGSDLPADYLSLRRNLTLLVCALLVLTMWAAQRDGFGA